MLIISLEKGRAADVFSQAGAILERGGIVAYATESFYALGVLATNEKAVKRLFEIKSRPADKPLPLIVSHEDVLVSIVKSIPDQARDFMKKYWPGPLTLIFEAGENIPLLLTGGTGMVAVRIPGKSTAFDLARYLNLPLTATSANISKKPPAVDALAVLKYFGHSLDLILDSGPAPGGSPSTIVDTTLAPPRVVRQGRVFVKEL